MGCFLCEAGARGVGEESLVLRLTRHSLVILNRYPYISGHLMVTPRDHVSDLDALSDDALHDLHLTLRECVRTVRDVLQPQGINVGMNLGKAAGAGLEEHLHYHVVPRFIGDSNAVNVLGNVRVIPEDLVSTWRRYRPAFESST